MKSFIILSVFLVLAWAGLIQPEKRTTPQMVSMINRFDDIASPLVAAVNSSYGVSKNLSYTGFGAANLYNNGRFNQAILPSSFPNVLAFGNMTNMNPLNGDLPYMPYISSTFGKTKALMDLNSFNYGCYCEGLHGYCRIFVFAYKNNVQKAWANYTYTWVDVHQAFAGFPMMPMATITDPGFKGIDTVRFTTHYYGNLTFGSMNQGTFIDDVNYNLYPTS